MLEENRTNEYSNYFGTELANIGDKKFSHPYYWAGFTIVGSPW